MHSFTSLVVRYEHWSNVGHLGVDQRLDPIRHRVVRVEDVEKLGTRGKDEIFAQAIETADGNKHCCDKKERKKERPAQRARKVVLNRVDYRG